MIAVDDDGDVRVVTLDRPDRRNALTRAGLDALGEAVENADAPVVYLRGAGDAFCAGADLDTVADVAALGADGAEPDDAEPDDVKADDAEAGGAEPDGADPGDVEADREMPVDGDDKDPAPDDPVAAFVRRGQRVADRIETADAVVVAGIDGAARGGGVELALACDLRIATPRATFGEPGVTFGLFGAWGGTVRLPEVVGMGGALDFSLSGRIVDAEEALRMGLVSRVVEDPRRVADDVAENDHSALEVIKDRVRDRGPKERQETREVDAFGRLVEEHAARLVDADGGAESDRKS